MYTILITVSGVYLVARENRENKGRAKI